MINDVTKLDYMLDTLKTQRDVMYNDSVNGKYELMHGLREKNHAVYNLYCEKYRLIWIDSHWNTIYEFIQKKLHYEPDKREVIDYFAENFRQFIEPKGFNNKELTKFFFDRLENEISIIKDMIELNDKHNENLNKLRNLSDIHKSEFEKIINQKLNEINSKKEGI